MANLALRRSGDSSVPGPRETLVETFRYWQHKSGGPDKEINMRNKIIEQYPPGIPMQVPKIDTVDKLPQLVMGILRGGDL